MLGGQLKQPAEGEDKMPIPLQNLHHPAHQEKLGTSTVKKAQQGRAALAPISRATLTPIKENGSSGSAPVPVVAFTTEHVRQGDNITEDKV